MPISAPALAAGIAVAQPDPSHAGGITECFRIATLADVRDVQLAPHCPLGPVALAACLQLDLAIPNFFAQEQTIGLHDPATADLGLIANPEVFTLVDGYLPRPTGPGSGDRGGRGRGPGRGHRRRVGGGWVTGLAGRGRRLRRVVTP